MNTLKILSLIGKVAGIALTVAASFGDTPIGLFYIFAGAPILKDVVNRIGDVVDDGKETGEFKE